MGILCGMAACSHLEVAEEGVLRGPVHGDLVELRVGGASIEWSDFSQFGCTK